MHEGIMMVPESAGVCCKTRGHEMKEVLTRKRRTSFLKWIVHKMHWTEDWGHHELPDKRGPLTAPEKHDHQPTTNNQSTCVTTKRNVDWQQLNSQGGWKEWRMWTRQLHCAKTYRPFELFANENHKLWNEAKMNAMFERGSSQDPSA